LLIVTCSMQDLHRENISLNLDISIFSQMRLYCQCNFYCTNILSNSVVITKLHFKEPNEIVTFITFGLSLEFHCIRLFNGETWFYTFTLLISLKNSLNVVIHFTSHICSTKVHFQVFNTMFHLINRFLKTYFWSLFQLMCLDK
jgi:hypothetical protein